MLQYIGARYVPIFYQNSLDPTSSEWEVNVTYEPLTWVSLPNGYMYISKKEVPANIGTPASNPDYWIEAGQYNAYIQSLQDQIDDMNDGSINGSLQNQINTMNDGSVNGSLQNQINEMNDGSVSGSLQDQINDMNDGSLNGSLQYQINETNTELSDLADKANIKNKKILVIGDSYAGVCQFIEKMSEYLDHGNTFTAKSINVSESSDGMIIKAARGGMGFTNNGGGKSSGNGFLTLLQEVVSDYTSDELADIDIILFAGCVNDAFYPYFDSDWGLLPYNMGDCATYIKTNFSDKVSVKLAFLGRVRPNNPSSITIPDLKIAAYRFSEYCGRFGWAYITNSEYIMYQNDGMLSSDDIHPVSGANTVIAAYLVTGLQHGSVDVVYASGTQLHTFTPDNTNLIGTATWIERTVRNGATFIRCNYLLEGTLGTTLTLNTKTKIGTQNAFYASQIITVPIFALALTGSTWHLLTLTVIFDGYDVYVKYKGDAQASSATTATAFTSVSQVAPFEFTIDTIDQ